MGIAGGFGLCLQSSCCGSWYALAVLAKPIRPYWSLCLYRPPALPLWSSGLRSRESLALCVLSSWSPSLQVLAKLAICSHSTPIRDLANISQGVYVLTDNSFRPFSRMSAEPGGQAVLRAQPVSLPPPTNPNHLQEHTNKPSSYGFRAVSSGERSRPWGSTPQSKPRQASYLGQSFRSRQYRQRRHSPTRPILEHKEPWYDITNKSSFPAA